MPLCLLHVPRPAACLPSSRSLEANTFTSPRPQYALRAPDLYAPTSTRFDCKAPELHTPTSPHLHACSPSPYLLISTPTACLRSSVPLRPYAGSAPLELHHLLHSHHIYKHIKQELDRGQEQAGLRAGAGERANFSPLPLRPAMRGPFKGIDHKLLRGLDRPR